MTDGSADSHIIDPGGSCVYTLLLGRYETLNEQPVASRSSLPFICFTDNPDLKSQSWEIRLVKPQFPSDPVRSQRLIKILPHLVLPEFGKSLYIDNTVLLKATPEKIIETYLADAPIALFAHSFRRRLGDEFIEIARIGLDDKDRVAEQLSHYSEQHPQMLIERPYWAGMLLRDHSSPQVRQMAEVWRDHVLRYSRRDQLSINLAIKAAGISPVVISEDNRESWFHTWPHGKGRKRARVSTGQAGWTEELQNGFSAILKEHDAERHELKRRLARSEAALARSDAGLARSEAAMARSEAKMARSDAALARSEAKMARSEAEIKALRASTSWRITAPLRAAVTTGRAALSSARALFLGWASGSARWEAHSAPPESRMASGIRAAAMRGIKCSNSTPMGTYQMHILRAENYRRMPWKNGGGETAEIAVSPEGAKLDDFDWRISMARVDSGGPFSIFPLVDRTLSILEGEGMVLDIEGREPVTLTSASVPHSFPADAVTNAELVAGAITDLNVMTRRGRYGHKVDMRRIDGSMQLDLGGTQALLFCCSGSMLVGDARQQKLGRFDAAILDSGGTLWIEGSAQFFVVEFDRVV